MGFFDVGDVDRAFVHLFYMTVGWDNRSGGVYLSAYPSISTGSDNGDFIGDISEHHEDGWNEYQTIVSVGAIRRAGPETLAMIEMWFFEGGDGGFDYIPLTILGLRTHSGQIAVDGGIILQGIGDKGDFSLGPVFNFAFEL